MKPCEQRQRAYLKEKGVRQRLKEKLEKASSEMSKRYKGRRLT